jgi:hypothetical protein
MKVICKHFESTQQQSSVSPYAHFHSSVSSLPLQLTLSRERLQALAIDRYTSMFIDTLYFNCAIE